jgi:2-C-methyl-D-erythritol 4-phosphate cytidylyltransferase/2-C-methyl-D-erythritol 2,4-cyclodiphosphate synthase
VNVDAGIRGFSVILLAGGSGVRMGVDAAAQLPKQYMPLGDKRVIDYSLDTFRRYSDDIVVAVPDPGDPSTPPPRAGVRLVAGGASREDSVRNALAAGLRHDAVLVHDAARPFVTRRVIADLLAALEGHESACPVMPVVNSIVVDDGGLLARTPPRSDFHEIQTPQAFRGEWLAKAMRDPAQAHPHLPERVRLLGGRVRHVRGTPWLFKITYAPDIHAANAYWREYLGAEG